jgi:hypothetical protein
MSKYVEEIEEKEYLVPYPVNFNRFSQEEILQLYENERIDCLLGMMAFADIEYKKKKKGKK